MGAVFLLLLLPLPLSVSAEDLGELSANPAGLSGSFGFSGLSGGVSDPTNKTNETDWTDEIDQFRLSVLTRLDQESLRRRESLQPQQSHESLRTRPPD